MIAKSITLLFAVVSIVYCKEYQFEPDDAIVESFKNLTDKLKDWPWLSVQRDDLTSLLKRKCEENGKPFAFYEREGPVEVVTSCMNKAIGPHELSTHIREGRVANWTKKFCVRTLQAEACWSSVVAVLRPCLAARELRHLERALAAQRRLFDALCADRGQNLTRLVEDSVSCYESGTLQLCVDRAHRAVDAGRRSFDGLVTPWPEDVFMWPNVERARANVEELRQCASRALWLCESRDSAAWLDATYDAVVAASETMASSAAGASGVLAALAAAAAARLL